MKKKKEKKEETCIPYMQIFQLFFFCNNIIIEKQNTKVLLRT